MGGIYWIASYPKSGNTWMRLMLRSLRSNGAALDLAAWRSFAPLAGHSSEFNHYLDIDAGELTQAELVDYRPDLAMEMTRDPHPAFRKVHDCWRRTPSGRPLFPPQATLGSLYLVRDPRDVAISLAHHGGITIDRSIAFMSEAATFGTTRMRGSGMMMEQLLLSWSNHVLSWRAADPAPLTVRYEDLRADPQLCLARVAAHLGMSVPASDIASAIEATRFDALKAAEAVHGFDIGQATHHRFFRRGEAGGWRDTLTTEQAKRIVADHGAVMRMYAYS